MKKSLLHISLPTLVTKDQKLKNLKRDEKARKLFVQRKKIGRLYDAEALRYWDPEKDEIKGIRWE